MPKKKEPALGADYSSKMKSRYAEKVKTSAKKYSKAHRRENRVVVNMKEEVQPESLKELVCHVLPSLVFLDHISNTCKTNSPKFQP